MDKYGAALYLHLAGLAIPPMQPLPKKTRAPKHSHPETDTTMDQNAPTRRRVDVAGGTVELPITAQATGSSSRSRDSNLASTSSTRGRGRGRGRQQTVEEMRAEFAQAGDPRLQSLFTRQSS
jgi:hypothetical protein